MAAENCVPLQRVGGGGVTHVSWSPDGSRLLAATPSALFRYTHARGWDIQGVLELQHRSVPMTMFLVLVETYTSQSHLLIHNEIIV